MRRVFQVAAVLLFSGAMACIAQLAAQTAPSQSPAAQPHSVQDGAEAEITALLQGFLAKVHDPDMHDDFWADDLIYISGDGKLKTKQQIVSAVRAEASQPASSKVPSQSFTAEDIKVRSYGSVATVNFNLLVHDPPPAGPKKEGWIRRFRNSGVFIRQGDGWRAVSWQATFVPETAKD